MYMIMILILFVTEVTCTATSVDGLRLRKGATTRELGQDTNFDYYAKYHECFLKQGLLINTSMCALQYFWTLGSLYIWSVQTFK